MLHAGETVAARDGGCGPFEVLPARALGYKLPDTREEVRGGFVPDYVLGEMFSGPGGIALGAEYASRRTSGAGGSSIRHGWAVEYHPDTARTYRENIDGAGEDTVFTADVRDFDLRKAPRFNAFAFGFPCNDFSTVGEHRGLDGDYGALYTFGVHALALHRPEWFIAENVSGLSKANGGMAFGKILSALRRPGAAALTDSHFTEFYGAAAEAVDEGLEYELVAHLYKFEGVRPPAEEAPIHHHRDPSRRLREAGPRVPGPGADDASQDAAEDRTRSHRG
jgi:DNA (cytosine-5)-methyltransferase 1